MSPLSSQKTIIETQINRKQAIRNWRISIFLRNFERPFTPRTWLAHPPNFQKTRFKWFPTFHFLTLKIFFRRKIWIENLVFRNFREVSEELEANGPQNQLPRQILLRIHPSWGLCDPKSWKKGSYLASASPIATSGAWFGPWPWRLIYGGGGGDKNLPPIISPMAHGMIL